MIDFLNTEIAFLYKKTSELKKAYVLFKLIEKPIISGFLTKTSLFLMRIHFPIHWFIKPLMFSHFCGGRNITEAMDTVEHLAKFKVFSILDFAVEGQKDDRQTEKIVNELKKTIDLAAQNPYIAFAAFKPTALAPADLLETINKSKSISSNENDTKIKFESRFNALCDYAAEKSVRLLIDAEEFRYQEYIDRLSEAAMQKNNKDEVYIFTTLQMYRIDRFDYLKDLIAVAREKEFKLGIKFVRGAYLEKERELAIEKGYPSPIYETKQQTDDAFDAAVKLCLENIDMASSFIGTHNQTSIEKAMDRMKNMNLKNFDNSVFFAQLYGMSDNLSFNLSKGGYNVTKYLPYGPVKVTIPYLMRRAQENTAMAGQTSRELQMVVQEMKRRKAEKN